MYNRDTNKLRNGIKDCKFCKTSTFGAGLLGEDTICRWILIGVYTTDDDEEATLSVDTCLSLPIAEKPVEKIAPPSPTPSLPPITTNRVQKQISLYESEQVSASEFKLIIPPKKLPDYRKRFYATESNSLSQFSSNDNISLSKCTAPSTSVPATSKTKSCMNLKGLATIPQHHHPGAIIVKEKFIDPPRRVTSSFHGHTRCGSIDERKLQRAELVMRASDPVMTSSNNANIRSRFVSTKVSEDVKDNNQEDDKQKT